jgi:hypothetical protein
MDGSRMEFAYDVFGMRQGKVLGYITYFSAGEPSIADESGLAEALAAKLREGDTALS